MKSLPQRPLTSALGTVATYRSQELLLELRRFPDSIQWRGSIGFLLRPMTYGLLGTKGFFEYFQLAYDARQNSFEIIPGSRLPT